MCAAGYIYAIAGKKETGPLATVDRFDLDQEKWSYVSDLESTLWDHAAAGHGNKVGVPGHSIKTSFLKPRKKNIKKIVIVMFAS